MNKCRYCDAPAQRILCGAADCKRRYNAERAYRYTPTCRRCGSTFAATRPGAKWCSMECRPQDARKARRLRRRVENLAARAAEGSTGTYVFIASADGSAVEVITPAQCSAQTQKSAIRVALESGDADAMVAALLAHAEPVGDCMVWQRKVDQRGYGEVSVAGKSYRTHRLMGEALFGPLHGEPIHHTCANRTCIAPAHMQRVSQRENVAEMLERTWYQRRIDELEKALAACAPDHHLLAGAA